MIKWFYLAIAFFLDSLLMAVFPYDYGLSNYNFTPGTVILALLILAKDFELYEFLSIAWVTGIIYGFIFYGDFFWYGVIFLLVGFIAKIWSIYITYSYLEYILLGLSLITIKEVLVFIIFTLVKNHQIPILLWLTKELFLTVLLNTPLIILMIYLSKKVLDYYDINSFKTNK
ncbi:MAG: hypothetical protein WC907_08675 [Acholeplasmataceae bacterium]